MALGTVSGRRARSCTRAVRSDGARAGPSAASKIRSPYFPLRVVPSRCASSLPAARRPFPLPDVPNARSTGAASRTTSSRNSPTAAGTQDEQRELRTSSRNSRPAVTTHPTPAYDPLRPPKAPGGRPTLGLAKGALRPPRPTSSNLTRRPRSSPPLPAAHRSFPLRIVPSRCASFPTPAL